MQNGMIAKPDGAWPGRPHTRVSFKTAGAGVSAIASLQLRAFALIVFRRVPA